MTHNASPDVTPRRSFLGLLLAAPALIARPDRARVPAEKSPSLQPRRGRRIVTGVDAEGRSIVVSDQPLIAEGAPADRPAGADFWVARRLPAPVEGPLEPSPEWKGGNQAPSGGVVGRVLTWPAGFSYRRHTTPTMDFIIVVSGQLELVLDTETRVLGAGDVAVQRGTAHAWRVVGQEPCTFVGVMLDAAVPKQVP